MMRRYFLFLFLCSITTLSWAHHSPGSTGGGLSVESAETLPQGEVSISYRVDFTSFQGIFEKEIKDMTLAIFASGIDHVHLDALRQSVLQTMTVSYGITDNLEVSWGMPGQYRAIDMREGHTHADGSYGYHSFGDIVGTTDSWITGKWQAVKGDWGKAAVLAGIKIPTGTTDARSKEPPSSTNSRILALDLQPSSGAIDWNLGLSFTRLITDQLSLDADARYTVRGTYSNFRAGDRFDGGIALAYRLIRDEAGSFAIGPFLEGNFTSLAKNQEWDTVEEVWAEEVFTGGTSFYVSPGLKASAGKNFSLALGVQLPLVQNLNSIQQKIDAKATAALSASF